MLLIKTFFECKLTLIVSILIIPAADELSSYSIEKFASFAI